MSHRGRRKAAASQERDGQPLAADFSDVEPCLASGELVPHGVTSSTRWLALPLLLGALVSLTVGLLAREAAIAPGSYPGGYFRLFFSDSLHLKVWFATVAVVLGLSQLFSAAWIFGKLPWRRPAWVPAVHRWVGRLAFACTLPVAYHCIFKLGFQRADTRVLAHSLLGCAFYGAFAAKVTVVRLHRFPGWVLPAAGGLLFVLLVGVWYTSALWFLRTVGVGSRRMPRASLRRPRAKGSRPQH